MEHVAANDRIEAATSNMSPEAIGKQLASDG